MQNATRVTNDDRIITTPLTLTSAHTKPGQALELAALTSLLQDARIEHLQSHNMLETNLDDNIGYIISHMDIDMLKQAYLLDELKIQIYSPGFKKNARGFHLNYQVIRESDRATIAQGSSTQLFYDFKERRLTRGPDNFHAIMHRNLRLLKLPLNACAAA